MKKLLLMTALLVVTCHAAMAQRFTDQLGRGLVAIPTGSTDGSTTNVVTWRRLADEYYGVTYNLYKDDTRIASNLNNTAYNDGSRAYPTTQYQVAAVVNGVEQDRCAVVTPWAQYVYKLGNNRCATGYIDINLAPVYDREGTDVTANYSPNDAEMADLDGDGELEIIIKRLNTFDASVDSPYGEMYSKQSTQFVVLDAYDINWQTGAATMLWRIDCGPNMVSLNSTEINIIAFDWDEDGKAEVVLRGADNMIVYGGDGQTQLYTIGDMTVNTRDKMTSHTDQQYAWTHNGNEYLIYMNGETGALYQRMTYPLRRLESGESSENTAWGDSYGHRSTKHFMGAPFLDGRKASLFLGRGIYTRHKMMAMDLDRGSHTWTTRWTWACNDKNSPWYGNGYHNFVVADVDEDGRDEIVYGSMVIDDNGHGLSTSGYEHGDAQHVSDFDPWRKGLETFACLEDGPYYGVNYRNATTSEVYYKHTGSEDDGRCLMDNFSNSYPGSMGRSVSSGGMMSSVTDQLIGGLEGDSYIAWGELNFRIYWDGDLLSEILNSPGEAREAKVEKPGVGRLFTSSGCNMNNGSKNNPCFQGDIIGDWREEIVVRRGTGLRVYTSGYYTNYSMPSLWFDHQYRQAMVWQMMAYNQPPHLSYFLGEMEDITIAPPPLTMRGRTEISNGGSIGTGYNGQHVLLCDNTSQTGTFSLLQDAQPSVITVNTPTWVQGTDVNGTTGTKVRGDGSVGATNLPPIVTDVYHHTLQGALSGSTQLTKQGDGTLQLTAATHTHTGPTNVWGGTLVCDGSMTASALWLNRFTTLVSSGTFGAGITMDYAARILPGGEGQQGTVGTTTLTMNYGARLVFDLFNTVKCDQVNASTLVISTKSWDNGPRYLRPVFQFVAQGSLPNCIYVLGNVGTITGSLDDVIVEGLDGYDYELRHENGQLQLVIGDGNGVFCAPAQVAETELVKTSEGILLPRVSVQAQEFTLSDSQQALPSLSATFTDRNGHVSDVDVTTALYSEDYEDVETVSGWTSPGANISLGTGDATYGNFFYVNTGSTNTRYAYTKLTGIDLADCHTYTVEFDLSMKAGNTDGIEFCVMSQNGTMPKNSWDNYASINSNANMLFDVTAPKSSTTFTVNGAETTTTLASEVWYHYTLVVDQRARTVNWSISNGDKGTFELPAGTSAQIAGFYLVAGRYYSVFKLDNIRIFSAEAFDYAFARPGVLTVTSSFDGCISSETSYEADFVGVSVGLSGFASLGCNYQLDLDVSGLQAYFVTGVTEQSVLVSGVTGSVPAATGLLLEGEPATYRLPIAAVATTSAADNLLQAVIDEEGYQVTTDDIYVLANKTSGVGFYLCERGVTVPAGKALLRSSASMGNARLSIDLEQVITGIHLPATESYRQDGGVVYTLSGVRTVLPARSARQKGIYIRDGKKIVIK